MNRPSPSPRARAWSWALSASAVLLGAATGCSLWNEPTDEASEAEAQTAPVVEAEEPERGGIGLLDPEGVEVVEFLGMDDDGGSTILIYTADFTNLGTYEPAPEPEEGEGLAELDFTSVETRDGAVVLTAEVTYLYGSGDLTVHADDFTGSVLPDGHTGDRHEEYTAEEEGVLAVVTPEEASAGFTLTFAGLPEMSLLRYELLSENAHVRDSQREPGPISAVRCVDAGGEDARVWSRTDGAPCDPDWG
ncbi:hypothetical protein [Nocardiopsis ganjiahuensis]|uniref:hypothetical protein n=1 Tax=Nocardiopsis ganjiahuensis TaxID=239984 RepID=UPI000347DD9F|nr:hypothetical protein [Nocardiopsis ganjiahuensis]